MFAEAFTSGITSQVLQGLVYLHSQNIIHRGMNLSLLLCASLLFSDAIPHSDLKPANLLIAFNDCDTVFSISADSTASVAGESCASASSCSDSHPLLVPVVKLCDFGTALKVHETQVLGRSLVGTPWFSAPELFRGLVLFQSCLTF